MQQHFLLIPLLTRIFFAASGSGLLLLPGPLMAQCTTTGLSAATAYSSNNGARGIMFDITANTNITISCLDANLYSAAGNIDVYYKAGTYAGSENTPGDWTLAGGPVPITTLGTNAATPIPLALNVVIPTGQTYGFFLLGDGAAGMNYTSGNPLGNVLVSDANLTVKAGVGKNSFAVTFGARDANLTVHYQLGAVFISLPVEMTDFAAEAVSDAVSLRWTTTRETNNAYFTLERSADAMAWEFVEQITGAGNSDQPIVYDIMDAYPLPGASYYRLSQTDANGERRYLGLRSVALAPAPYGQRKLFPNPVKDLLTIQAAPGARVRVFDAVGRQVQEAESSDQESFLVISLGALPAGVYQVEVIANGVRTVHPVARN